MRRAISENLNQDATGVRPGWTLVVAVSQNNVIGRNGALPWRLSSDLKRFKRLTMGHCLLMGRRTFESIGRPLPGRQTIVLSKNKQLDLPDEVTVVTSFGEVDAAVLPDKQVMVVGGGEVYSGALPYCERMWITRVLHRVDGEVTFPTVDWDEWTLVSREAAEAGPKDDYPSEFEVWQRKRQS